MRNAIGLGGVIALLCWAAVSFAAEDGELDREIRRLKKEIARVQVQRKNEAEEVKKDREEYRAYTKRTKQRMESISRQTDSINGIRQQIDQRNDSLRAVLASVQSGIREQELFGEKIRTMIISAVTTIQAELPTFPPLLADQYRGPLGYLLSELQAGSVENTEALYRLMRIVQDLRTTGQEIQVVEGVSPVPLLRGSVYRLRIGAVFEAIVDSKGRRGFLWTPVNDDRDTMWVAVGDETTAAALLKAVNIREGKTVPELVDLPLGSGRYSEKEHSDEE